MTKALGIATATVMFLGLVSAVNAVTVFDPVTDFSETANTDSSTWSYRYAAGATRTGSYALLPLAPLTLCAPATIPWRTAAIMIGVNRTGATATCQFGPPISWPDNALFMHPGGVESSPGIASVVLSWLAPENGNADISYSFRDMDPNGGDGVDWFIDLGDASGNLASGFVFNDSTELQQINDVVVMAGDRINFVVAPREAGSSVFDSTQVGSTSGEPAGSRGGDCRPLTGRGMAGNATLDSPR